MLAKSLSAFLARRGIHYGWVVAAVTFLMLLTTAGAMGLPGALILPLNAEFGWGTAAISSALAVRIMLYGLMAPFAASLMNRYGLRNVAVTSTLLICLALIAATLMREFWQMMLLWGLVVGLATGLTAMVFAATVANRWFVARRGLLVGLLSASSATGQLAFLPLGAWLATNYGWRAALLPAGIGVMVAGLLAILFLADRPSDLGIAAYGEEGVAAPPPPAGGNAIKAAFVMLGEASRHPAFWALFATFFICGLSTNGLIQTHFISFCSDFGMPSVDSATVLAMMGVFDFVGTVASGWLSDRYDCRKLLFWYYGLRGLSLLWLPSSTFSIYGLSIFAMFYGLDWIATVPPTVRISAGVFGREKGGLVFGWVFMGHQLGAAVAAFGAGLSRSELSTYLPAFYGAGAACLVAALLALAARPRRRKEEIANAPVPQPA
ncbi:Sugar phosphate permease [Rhizobiales bacterium GAS191]|jgi:sugar phosphate permease|nr:Sugar phosphate permease [Rhizobiales bacterium GAS188]SED01355.1 Sugar phosphate permease [Rhizobiales bacterium GAS191]